MSKQRRQLKEIGYPRRRILRSALRTFIRAAITTLADIKVEGRENLPEDGPLLVVANHFSFIDPVALIHATPWPLEFIGGANRPHAPAWTKLLPAIWGYLPVYRGTTSLDTLRASERILSQKGVLGIFPEAGSWAAVLRPPRPGAAFLAARTEAQILPVGLINLTQVFPRLSKGRRAHVTVRIGEPFGPVSTTGRGRERRRQLDVISQRIMERIADLLPPEKRGVYAEDPTIREAAQEVAEYPWGDEPDYKD